MTAVCAGTTKKGDSCTRPAARASEYCYLHDPDPAIAERRSRNASRAATLGNSRVGAEIRSTRLLVRDLVETTISGELDPLVRKRLAEVVQLLQVYARLAELEINAGERPRPGEVKLPEDLPERIRGWTEGEEAKEQERQELAGELSAAMRAHGRDPAPIREAMGGQRDRAAYPAPRVFMRRHEILGRLECVGPRERRKARPDEPELYRIVKVDFGEFTFHALGWIKECYTSVGLVDAIYRRGGGSSA